MSDGMHGARLVLLEGALCALLREAQFADPSDAPDGINVRATIEDGQSVIEVEYMRGSIALAGESL